MPDATNLQGERGGVFVADDTWTASEVAENKLGFLVHSETATITAITMKGWDDTESAVEALEYPQGFYFAGTISSITVTGTIQLFDH